MPNDMGKDGIDSFGMLVYLSIRRFVNSGLIAYPSLRKISTISGLCVNRIRDLIDGLMEKDYIERRKDSKKNVYVFKDLA